MIYKTFAEVLLLHEFYHTDSEGKTIFDIALQTDKVNYLLANYNQSDPAITDDLRFEPTDFSKKLFANHRIRILPAISGFRIVIEVTEKKLADGSTVYTPLIPLPDNFNINIRLVKNDTRLDRYSNSRVHKNIPALYLFSNDNTGAVKSTPSLSNPVPAFNALSSYEMGELSFKDNLIKQFMNDGSADPWAAITSDGYVNEADRLLVYPRFNYAFNTTDNINQANFVLKDNTGATIKTINNSSSSALQTIALDFSDQDLHMIEDFSSPAFYSLAVSGNNNYTRDYQLLFINDPNIFSSCWGMVNMRPRVQSAAYNLIDDNGYLVSRVSAAGIQTEAPVFEIRIKSRLAHWQYLSNTSTYKLNTSSSTQDFLTNSNGVLTTKKPRTTTYSPTMFTTDGNTFQNLPNPPYETMVLEKNNKFYRNVLVGQSDMFPFVNL